MRTLSKSKQSKRGSSTAAAGKKKTGSSRAKAGAKAKKPVLSVILPTFNEAGNIGLLVTAIDKVRKEQKLDIEINVVDDDSPDGTAAVVRDLQSQYKNLRLLVRTENPGLAPSVRDGIEYSRSDIVVWMDADMSMSPSLLPSFVEAVREGADLAVGSRYIEGGGMKGSDPTGRKTSFWTILRNLRASEDSIISAIISRLGNRVIKMILNSELNDFSSGYFGGKREFFQKFPPEGSTVDYCIALPYRATRRGYNVVEIPMILDTRKYGKSKTSDNLWAIFTVAVRCFWRAGVLRFTTPRIPRVDPS